LAGLKRQVDSIQNLPAVRVDGSRLSQVLAGLPRYFEFVGLRIQENNLVVFTSNSEFNLPIDGTEFPGNPIQISGGNSIVLVGSQFRELIAGTAWATKGSTEMSAMSSIAVFVESLKEENKDKDFVNDGDNAAVSFVATDGRKLALSATGCNCQKISGPEPIGLLRVSRIQKIMGFVDLKSIVKIGFSKSAGRLEIADESMGLAYRVDYPLPVGKFPDYRVVLPKEKPCSSFEVAGNDLLEVFKQASVTADFETQRLEIAIEDWYMTLAAQGSGGRSRVQLKLNQSAGKAKINLNCDYAIESVKGLGTTKVEIWAKEKPILFTASGRSLPRWVLLMPQV
jgi:DNA polymerase III sliding clamp (beta) subunit (PCNA family)